MSIFNTRFENGIDIRGNSAYFEDVFQKNKITQEFERVGTGGDNPTTLPDYLRDNSILFRDTEEILNGPKLDAIKLDSLKLNEIDSIILPAHESSLEELDTKNTNLTTRVTNIEGVNTTQNNKITSLENKTASISKPAASSTLIASINNKFYTDSNGVYVFNSPVSSTPIYPHFKLNPTSLEIYTSITSSVFLDTTRIDKIAKILQVTDSVWDTNLSITKPLILTGTSSSIDTVNKKMLVIDNDSKNVSYVDIPSPTLPAYLKPKYKLLSIENNELLPFTINTGIITVGGTVQPFNFNLNEGEKVVFGPSTSTMKQNTWYAFLLNGRDISKQPSYRLSVNSDSTIGISNNTDDYYTMVSKALIYNVGGGGNKRYICFKIVNLKDTSNTTGIVPTPTFITLEFLKNHVYDNPAY